MRFGYCVNMLAEDPAGVGYDWIARLAELGFDYVDLPMAQMMVLSDEEFESLVLRPLRESGLPCVCSNNLFPASHLLTGPDADHDAAYAYCEKAFSRAAQLGASRLVFGSSGARNVPFGFPREEAARQLAALLTRLSPLAHQYGLTMVLEPLNRAESNILTSIRESVALCRAVHQPTVRMLVDSYHMSLSGETAADVAQTTGMLQHVHIARPLGRGLPCEGDGEDYPAFFRALRAAGYDDAVSMEAYLENQAADAIAASLRYLRDCAEAKGV